MLESFQKWRSDAKSPHNRTDLTLFWLAWLLHLPLPFFLVYALVNGDWRNVVGNLLAIIVAFIPRWMESRSQNRFPAVGEFAISITLLVEMIGRTFHLYKDYSNPPHLIQELGNYDTYAHSIEIGMMTLFLVMLLYAFFLEHKVDYDTWFIIVVGVLIGLALGGAWEIFEWIIDKLFDAGYQDGLDDTMVDLFVGGVGAFFGSLAARAYRSRHDDEAIMKELPIFYEWF